MQFVGRIPPQPSNIDLAICIILLRSQPSSLRTVEYIRLLQSMTVPGTYNQWEDSFTFTRVTDVLGIGGLQKWRKLLEIANGKIMQLKAKISDVEKERDVLRAKVKGLQTRTAAQNTVKMKKVDDETALGPPEKPFNRLLHNTLSISSKEYEPQVPSMLCLHDLAPWAEFAPQLLDSLKFLQHATEPKTISATIQQTCRMLSRLTQSLCEGINVDLREEGGLDRSLCVVPQIHGPKIAKSLPLVLLNAITEVLAALVKLHPPRMPSDITNSKPHSASTNDEDTALASNAIMTSLASILSSIHTNSITILQHLTKQVNIAVAHSNGLPSTSSNPISPSQYVPTGKGTTLYSASSHPSHMVPDLRKGITSFFIQLIRTLRGDIQQHRDLIEAMTFSLMTLFGSQIALFNTAQNLQELSGIGYKDRKSRGKQTHERSRVDIISEEKSLYIQDLAGEETSWFLLEILDVLWERYLGSFEYMNMSPNGRPPQACNGTLDEAGDIHTPHFTCITSRKSMVTEAKRKLKEALLQAVLGPTGAEGPGRNMRLSNVPVLNEIWRMIGWDEQV